MRLVWGTNASPQGFMIGQWCASRIPHVGHAANFGDFVAFGVARSDGADLLGAVVYHNHVPGYRTIDISCAAASQAWLTAAVIRGILSYPFDQLQVERVTAVTPRHAASARRFLKKFGFRQEGAHPKAFGDFGDGISFGLVREDWQRTPWARGRLNPEPQPKSSGLAYS